MNTKRQIPRLENIPPKWVILFLFCVFGNKVKSQIFIQDSSTFYVSENTNVSLERGDSPAFTTSKIYIVKGTKTNIHTDSNNGEIVYLETTDERKRVIIPKVSSKKKLIAQSKKKTIRYTKGELYNTFCHRFVSLLLLKQKIFISSNISRKENDKKQGVVRHLVQLDRLIRDSTTLTYHLAKIHYWSSNKETKKVRPPPMQA